VALADRIAFGGMNRGDGGSTSRAHELVQRLEGGENVDGALAELAAADPGALAPYASRLVAAGATWRLDLLYRAGNDAFQQELVSRIENGSANAAFLVQVLTQTRGPVAEAAFRRWGTAPPAGIDPYNRGVTALVRDGGWELAQGSGYRELCGTTAYRLTPAPAASQVTEICPWCRSALWTALDVHTDEPAVAAALAHTGWQGRLRIDICVFCSAYGPVLVAVTPDGHSSWSGHTTRPGYLPDGPPETRPRSGSSSATAGRPPTWRTPGTRAAPPSAASPTPSKILPTNRAPPATRRCTTWASSTAPTSGTARAPTTCPCTPPAAWPASTTSRADRQESTTEGAVASALASPRRARCGARSRTLREPPAWSATRP